MMNTIGQILAVLNSLAALALLYLAAGVLQSEEHWQRRVKDFEKAVADVRLENDRLEHGGQRAQLAAYRLEDGLPKNDQPDLEDRPGVEQWKLVLNMLAMNRGRVWQGRRGDITPTGETSVTIEQPKPHNVKDQAILYAFENRTADAGGVYLGEFKVSGVTDQTLALTPALRLVSGELEKLQQSQASWVLYEAMPTDRFWAFSGMSEDQLNKMLPEASRANFLRNGKPAGDQDDAANVVERNGEKLYARPLRDYVGDYLEMRKQLAAMQDVLLTRATDVDGLKKTLAAAENQVGARDAEIEGLKTELQKSTAERDLVAGQEKALAARITAIETETSRLLAENKKLAAQLVAAQMEAAGKMQQLSKAARLPAR